MPKRLFRDFDHTLAFLSVSKALENKWRRRDVVSFIEEWTGRSRLELARDELERGALSYGLKYEILDELALTVEDMVGDIVRGIDPDFDPVRNQLRPDGNTGKIRNIALLCIRHQILGHVVKLGIEPLLRARLLPTQHASIPEKGQTGLARQVKRMLNRKLGIQYAIKTDCTGAYASVQYSVITDIFRKEIPRARWIFPCMRILERYAPGGHLIIGGYLDAWLFNFVMSYALRYVLTLNKSRRGNRVPLVIRAVTFMDDLLLLGRNRRALLVAVERLKEWMFNNFGMSLHATTDPLRIFSIEEEKARKHRHGAGRGCPAVDMGGYLIHRTYITLRKRNAPKIIRCFDRAWAEYKRTGTIKRQRACQIIARNGMVKNSNSFILSEKHHAAELMRVARRVQGYWSREANRKRKEYIFNVIAKHEINVRALSCFDG